jgi:hypothetical protein
MFSCIDLRKLPKNVIRSLSWINTAPVLNVLSNDISTYMELSFISKICKFWIEETVMYFTQKHVTEMCSAYNFCLS